MRIEVCLSFGSNCGDRRENVRQAVLEVGRLLADLKVSSIYETPECHGIGNPYCNAVASGITDLNYERLNQILKRYEIGKGRDDKARERGDVVIDIDIVKWNSEIIRPQDYSREFFQIGYKEIAAI